MDTPDVFKKMSEIEIMPELITRFHGDDRHAQLVADHKTWLSSIRHERPSTEKHFKVGIYIRYFNQTKYSNYLYYHKKQFEDTLALCPNWELAGIYVDEGATAPNMENAAGWSELLNDVDAGKVDLIITQKISNISKKIPEATFCARILAARNPPVGIYFISEDLFTLASYYQNSLRDTYFLPSPEWELLPDDPEEVDDQSEEAVP